MLQYRPDLPRQASEGGLVNSFDGMRLQHSSELAEVARKIDGARNMSAAEKARGAFVQTCMIISYHALDVRLPGSRADQQLRLRC